METDTFKELVRDAQTWPSEDQQELAEYGRSIKARRSGHYVLTKGERAAVAEGKAQADRGAFVSEERMTQRNQRHGL